MYTSHLNFSPMAKEPQIPSFNVTPRHHEHNNNAGLIFNNCYNTDENIKSM